MAISSTARNSLVLAASLSFCIFVQRAAATAPDTIYIPKPGEETSSEAKRVHEQLRRDPGTLPNAGDADLLYDEAIRARFELQPEKSRALFEQAIKAKGSMRAKVKSRIYLKSYLPRYPMTPECEKQYREADQLVQHGKLSEALALFQSMETEYPKLEWVPIGLAAIHLKREDPERAANCARRALAINPDYVDAWLILSHECLMHHDMEGAQATTQQAHNLDPYSEIVSKALNAIDNEMAKKRPD
jgi:predicted Zn-dependent protease